MTENDQDQVSENESHESLKELEALAQNQAPTPRHSRPRHQQKKRRGPGGRPKGSRSSTPIEKASTPMLKASSSTTESDRPKLKRAHTFVWRPLDEGDRLEHEVPGTTIRLRANIPQEISDDVYILQLHREERETPDGIRSRAIERKVPLYIAYKDNPWFEIDGVQPPRIQAAARVPETSDEYRGYAISWITLSSSADSMDQRWAGEEGLRQRCGVTASDRAQIIPYFQARRQECGLIDSMRAGRMSEKMA